MGTSRRVVLADDDVLLREGLASLLERSGFEVVAQAVETIRPLVDAKRHRLELHDMNPDAMVSGDPVMVTNACPALTVAVY